MTLIKSMKISILNYKGELMALEKICKSLSCVLEKFC